MNRLLKYYVLAFLIFGIQSSYGQQLPHSTSYLVNPYSLSPSLAGLSDHSEAFINYRNDWTKIDGAPSTFTASGFGNIYQNKLWIGGDLTTDRSDILSVFRANLSLSYKLQVEYDQFLYFGIWSTFYQASVRVGEAIGIDPNDPLLINNTRINSSAFNAGFGINYNWRNLNLGFSMPGILSSNDEYGLNTEFKYQVQRQFQFHASYLIDISSSFQLQTIGVYRKTGNLPATFDLSVMSIIHGRFWAGMLYRNSGVIAINAGGHIYNGFTFNYSYEIGTGSINKASGGTHEITIGYRFNFNGSNYFKTKESEHIKKKRRNTRISNYPEVKDYNYRRR